MSIFVQSHGGPPSPPQDAPVSALEAAPPATGDVAVDEAADFGYLFPPSGDPNAYLPNDVLAELDELGNRMIPAETNANEATPDSQSLPPVFTYWGQFLDHELTARTDRDGTLTSIEAPAPSHSAPDIEAQLKNARTPRFDLDSVYGGVPVGPDITPSVATVISALRHPTLTDKMRVGTASRDGDLPDGLDRHRDLPRFSQASQDVRDAFLDIVRDRLSAAELQAFEASLDKRALIGDMRNDENLIIAQFHLSFLRFHNRAVDFLAANETGWRADYDAAKTLTKLHYQHLVVEEYLKTVCDPAVVNRVVDSRAAHFFAFRAAYAARNTETLGNAIPLEFSVAAYRFGHTMVRNVYDFNKTFGRPNDGAPFDDMFAFTGGGGFGGAARLPQERIIDWDRFVGTSPHDGSDGGPARLARAIDTALAPPLGDLAFAGEGAAPDVRALMRHLARRNLRRGFSLRLPTGQALHQHLFAQGAVTTPPIADVASLLNDSALADFVRNSTARFSERTPLWFYLLAEAEGAGGNRLGELGSFLVASTFCGVLFADPGSALSRRFDPSHSPLTVDGHPIATIADWMTFASVME